MHMELCCNGLPCRVARSLPPPFACQAEVARLRSAAECYLLQHLQAVPYSAGLPGVSWRLLVASGAQPTPAPADLMSLAWGPLDMFRAFNPFLSDSTCAQLRGGVLLWLQLCVLEDRLERIAKLVGAGEEFTPLLIRVRGGGWRAGGGVGRQLPARVDHSCCASSAPACAATGAPAPAVRAVPAHRSCAPPARGTPLATRSGWWTTGPWS
jgi:hypothetical protein